MIYSQTTMPFYIEMLCKDFADKNAIVWKTKYRTEYISYRSILRYSQKTALFLLNKNLSKQNKILIIGPNCPHWIVSFFGTQLAGMILIPVDFNSNSDFIKKITEQSEPDLFILSKTVESKMPKNINSDKIIFLEDIFALVENFNCDDIKKYSFYITDSDIAEIIFTSGTTDNPKGVVLTHRNIGANIYCSSIRMNIASGTKLLSILPLSHMLEQTAGLFTPLRQGGQVVYIQSMKPGAIKSALKSERVQNMVATPAFLDAFKNLIYLVVEKKGKLKAFDKLVGKAEKFPLFLKRIIFGKIINELGGKIKYVVSGGSKLKNETERFWNNIGITVLQGYGLTETSPVISCASLKDNKAGSVGKVLPYQYIKLAEDGEIITAGENVFHGYLNHPELNKNIFENGWFKTGDIGEIDEEGFLYIKGRKKNMIAAPSGLNIYPEDIESKLNKHSLIKESVVLANYEPNFYLYAFVISENQLDQNKLNEILLNVNKELSDHQKLKSISVWIQTDFPRTPTKKIIRREIEELVKKNKSGNPDELFSQDKKNKNDLDKIISIISEIIKVPADSINKESRFVEDIGLDSISKLELITKLETEFFTDISEEDFYKINNVGEVLSLIEKSKSKENIYKIKNILSDLRFSFLIKIVQSFIFIFIRFFSLMFFRVKSKNPKYLFNLDQPVIFIANHASHLDILSILRALPSHIRRRIHTAAAQDYFYKNKFIGVLFSFFIKIFPFYRKEMMRTNLTNIGKILDNKEYVLIFPEGTRSRDGKMQQFKEGIGMIVKAMDVPCIPIRLDNTFNLLPFDKKIPKQGTVKINFGEMIRFTNNASYSEIADTLYNIIKKI